MTQTTTRRPFSAERRSHLKPKLTQQGFTDAVTAASSGEPLDPGSQFALLRAEIAEIRMMLSEEKDGSGQLPKLREGGSNDAGLEQEEADTIQAVQIEIAQMVKSIARAKAEIASIKHPHSEDDRLEAASNELDAIVTATEVATTDILNAAEVIELEATNLAGMCHEDQDVITSTERIVSQVVKILEASNFQDITGQRINKVVETVRYIEERIVTMIDIWGVDAFGDLPLPSEDSGGDEDLLNGPQLENQGISQADIDALFD